MSAAVRSNHVVHVTCTLFDERGGIFERSDMRVGYVHGGKGPLFEPIERALDRRGVGDRVEVSAGPQDAFGTHKPEPTFTDDVANVPPEHRRIGSEVVFENERGEQMQFRVTRIENGRLTIDANHPLAGQRVRFVVIVAAVRPATLDQVANRLPEGMQWTH